MGFKLMTDRFRVRRTTHCAMQWYNVDWLNRSGMSSQNAGVDYSKLVTILIDFM